MVLIKNYNRFTPLKRQYSVHSIINFKIQVSKSYKTMRFLKNKILLAQEFKKHNERKQELSRSTPKSVSKSTSSISSPSSPKKRRALPAGVIITPEKIRCTKNIAKNYGSAIATFACSEISKPYLKPFLQQENLSMEAFIFYAKQMKKLITGIDSFRNSLLVKPNDTPINASCKRVFQKISEVFIKYFSVNWIFTARIAHKLVYLKYRGKMLRRVQCPELFTYVKG